LDKQKYLNSLSKKFERYFDIEFQKEVLGIQLDMVAKHYSLNVRTFLTNNDIIDSYENNEYIFIKHYSCLDDSKVKEFCNFLKDAADFYVSPKKNHMSTYINGIILYDSIDEGTKVIIRKFRNSKTFLFGLKGWFDTRLLAVGLNGQDIICNREGKRVKKVYQITP